MTTMSLLVSEFIIELGMDPPQGVLGPKGIMAIHLQAIRQ